MHEDKRLFNEHCIKNNLIFEDGFERSKHYTNYLRQKSLDNWYKNILAAQIKENERFLSKCKNLVNYKLKFDTSFYAMVYYFAEDKAHYVCKVLIFDSLNLDDYKMVETEIGIHIDEDGYIDLSRTVIHLSTINQEKYEYFKNERNEWFRNEKRRIQ